jgi:hypothetical protein
MDGLGDQLLARSAFTLDENRGIRRGGVFDQLVDDPHLRVFTDDAAEFGRAFYPLLEIADLLLLKGRAP